MCACGLYLKAGPGTPPAREPEHRPGLGNGGGIEKG